MVPRPAATRGGCRVQINDLFRVNLRARCGTPSVPLLDEPPCGPGTAVRSGSFSSEARDRWPGTSTVARRRQRRLMRVKMRPPLRSHEGAYTARDRYHMYCVTWRTAAGRRVGLRPPRLRGLISRPAPSSSNSHSYGSDGSVLRCFTASSGAGRAISVNVRPLTPAGVTELRGVSTVAKGKRTFQPNNRRRARVHGFRLRMRTRAGRSIVSARRRKGRASLTA